MDRRLSAALACLAFALASVTAISVAMTIFSLLDDPLLAVLFSGAAVLLDIFKYIGWPLAARLNQVRRRFSAMAICSCVAALGLVSGWSTYDRLLTSIESSKAKQSAMTDDRLAHLTSLIKKDSEFVKHLDESEKKIEDEASELRARGMVTKASELESLSLDRLDRQRLAAMERMKTNSMEIAEIRTITTKAASVPLLVAALLCAGFALSLELVPALLLTGVRNLKEESSPRETINPLSFINATSAISDNSVEPSSTSGLLAELLQTASALPVKSKIKVKDFATNNRIGNLKACAVFREAEALGAIRKTRLGYITI